MESKGHIQNDNTIVYQLLDSMFYSKDAPIFKYCYIAVFSATIQLI